MRRLSREIVVQAMATLGVRLSGAVSAERFAEARQFAVESQRPLMLATHPDRHAMDGHLEIATRRAQEISAAAHLLQACAWFEVAELFAAERPSFERQWGMWSGTTNVAGSRFYARCPMCSTLVQSGERHSCRVGDHFKTKSRPFSYERPWKVGRCPQTETRIKDARTCQCSKLSGHDGSHVYAWPEGDCMDESPLGAFCNKPPGHDGSREGYSKQGRHSWKAVRPDHTEENVDVG